MRIRFPERLIEPEWLDGLPPGEGRASLADLVRLNQRWGGYSSVRKLLDRAVDPDESFSLLDIGAASGNVGDWIRRLRPRARITSLDRVPHHLELARAPKVVSDAFQLPFADGAFDFAFSSLFLHHFTAPAIVRLLRESARVTRRGVLAVDLERHFLAYHFLPVTQRVFGWDPVTVHDGKISVAAGFKGWELRQLAEQAGFREPEVHTHGLAFRVTMYAAAQYR